VGKKKSHLSQIAKMSLRRIHALGKSANRKAEQRKKAGGRTWGTLEKLGAKTQSKKNRLMEARRFAQLCDDEELEILCGLRRTKKWKLSWWHVVQLIRIKDSALRIKLAKSCAANAWSVRALQLEIDQQGLHRPYGGRTQEPPGSEEKALHLTERLLKSLIRWERVVSPKEIGNRKKSEGKKRKRSKKERVNLAKPHGTIRDDLAEIATSAFEFCERIRDELQKRRRKSPKKSSRRRRKKAEG